MVPSHPHSAGSNRVQWSTFCPSIQVQPLKLELFLSNSQPLGLWILPVFWDLWHLLAPRSLTWPSGLWSLAFLYWWYLIDWALLLTLPCLAHTQDGSMALRTCPWAVHCAKTHRRGMLQWLACISIIISWIYFQPIHILSQTNLFLTFSLFLLLPYKLPFQPDVVPF